MTRKRKIKKANIELKSVLKYLIRTDVITSMLAGILSALDAFELGSISGKVFLITVGFLIVKSLVNAFDVWIKEYNQAQITSE